MTSTSRSWTAAILYRTVGLLSAAILGQAVGPRPQRLDVHDYARFIGLTFQGTNTLSRLLRVRHDLPGNDRWQEIMDAALDGLSKEWGIEL